MVAKAKKHWGRGLINLLGIKGKTIMYNMIGGNKQQEIDLKIYMDEFSNASSSTYKEESSTSKSIQSSIEIQDS